MKIHLFLSPRRDAFCEPVFPQRSARCPSASSDPLVRPPNFVGCITGAAGCGRVVLESTSAYQAGRPDIGVVSYLYNTNHAACSATYILISKPRRASCFSAGLRIHSYWSSFTGSGPGISPQNWLLRYRLFRRISSHYTRHLFGVRAMSTG